MAAYDYGYGVDLYEHNDLETKKVYETFQKCASKELKNLYQTFLKEGEDKAHTVDSLDNFKEFVEWADYDDEMSGCGSDTCLLATMMNDELEAEGFSVQACGREPGYIYFPARLPKTGERQFTESRANRLFAKYLGSGYTADYMMIYDD